MVLIMFTSIFHLKTCKSYNLVEINEIFVSESFKTLTLGKNNQN